MLSLDFCQVAQSCILHWSTFVPGPFEQKHNRPGVTKAWKWPWSGMRKYVWPPSTLLPFSQRVPDLISWIIPGLLYRCDLKTQRVHQFARLFRPSKIMDGNNQVGALNQAPTAREWKEAKSEIQRHYILNNSTLLETMAAMESQGFAAR